MVKGDVLSLNSISLVQTLLPPLQFFLTITFHLTSAVSRANKCEQKSYLNSVESKVLIVRPVTLHTASFSKNGSQVNLE